MELIAEIFIRSWFGSAIKHVGAGLRYSCLWLFRRGEKVSYRHIRLWFGGFQQYRPCRQQPCQRISRLPRPRSDSDSNSQINF